MPAQKAHRQSVKRYARNMSVRRATRTAINRARRAVATADPDSEEAVRNAGRFVQEGGAQAVKKGILHKNNASRRKGRLAAALNRSRAG